MLPKRPRISLDPSSYKQLCQQVMKRDGWRCQVCGSSQNLQVHHKQPRSQQGSDRDSNLITLCASCHEVRHHGYGENPRPYENDLASDGGGTATLRAHRGRCTLSHPTMPKECPSTEPLRAAVELSCRPILGYGRFLWNCTSVTHCYGFLHWPMHFSDVSFSTRT
jgi:hypothetical protein